MEFAQGTIIRWDDSATSGKGVVRGVANNGVAVLGKSWIIEVTQSDPPIPNKTYPYTHRVVFGVHIKEVL